MGRPNAELRVARVTESSAAPKCRTTERRCIWVLKGIKR
jgi:hypothetical protein